MDGLNGCCCATISCVDDRFASSLRGVMLNARRLVVVVQVGVVDFGDGWSGLVREHVKMNGGENRHH